jgi:hypothetical protein
MKNGIDVPLCHSVEQLVDEIWKRQK